MIDKFSTLLNESISSKDIVDSLKELINKNITSTTIVMEGILDFDLNITSTIFRVKESNKQITIETKNFKLRFAFKDIAEVVTVDLNNSESRLDIVGETMGIEFELTFTFEK